MSPVMLTGTDSSFTGPGSPANYTVDDPAADYGSIGSNDCFSATANCYEMTVGNPVSRPAPHWDASFKEALSTGGAKTWTLHVGNSFSDVSNNTFFYPFIETLFHNGVTTGFGNPLQYGPLNGVLRSQMAAFLLRAEHGSGYVPPACGPLPSPPFAPASYFVDVPCPGPGGPGNFSDFIYQLAQEGITTGCNPAQLKFCPSDTVSRAQMAIFLLRAEHGSGYVPPACGPLPQPPFPASSFTDVTCPGPGGAGQHHGLHLPACHGGHHERLQRQPA